MSVRQVSETIFDPRQLDLLDWLEHHHSDNHMSRGDILGVDQLGKSGILTDNNVIRGGASASSYQHT